MSNFTQEQIEELKRKIKVMSKSHKWVEDLNRCVGNWMPDLPMWEVRKAVVTALEASERLDKLEKQLLSEPTTVKSHSKWDHDKNDYIYWIEVTTYSGPDDERVSTTLSEAIDRLGVDEIPEHIKEFTRKRMEKQKKQE